MQNKVLVLDTNRKPLMPCHPRRARKLLESGRASVFRRHRKTRYRAPRFLNRTKPKGWLPPSVRSKAENILNWVTRFKKLVPISKYALETAKFDTQKLENPEIQGNEYQQGRMYGYEDKRAYLLERENRCCIYCDVHASKAKMEVEHVVPKSKGGTDSLNNLVLACHECNQAKGSLSLAQFLKGKPTVLRRVKTHLGANYRDAAHTNSIRLYVMRRLSAMGELTVGYGYTTSKNRVSLGLPKDHWIDAAVCTDNGSTVKVNPNLKPLIIKATGRGSRQFCSMNKYGFPRTSAKPRSKNFFGFKTGDIIKVTIPKDAKTKMSAGVYMGRVVTRSSGRFDIKVKDAKINVSHKHCELIYLMDGYSYE